MDELTSVVTSVGVFIGGLLRGVSLHILLLLFLWLLWSFIRGRGRGRGGARLRIRTATLKRDSHESQKKCIQDPVRLFLYSFFLISSVVKSCQEKLIQLGFSFSLSLYLTTLQFAESLDVTTGFNEKASYFADCVWIYETSSTTLIPAAFGLCS